MVEITGQSAHKGVDREQTVGLVTCRILRHGKHQVFTKQFTVDLALIVASSHPGLHGPAGHPPSQWQREL